MELTIEKTNENVYLQRKEMHGKVTFTGATPSQKQLVDALAQKTGAKADTIFIQHLFTSFGSQSATFEAHVYLSKEQLEKVVRLGKKAKEKLAKPAATPAEAPKAEAPKTEEKKAEPVKPVEKAEAPKKEEKPAEQKKVEA